MRSIYAFLFLSVVVRTVLPAPANGFVFPDERRPRKLEPVITPPVLPYLEHLERDPSTLLPNEKEGRSEQVNPKFGFGGGFNLTPSNGGFTGSVSSSASGGGGSQSASQSFAFGFNEGFSASHSASQSASFNGFGSGFGGSQSSSQAAAFGAGSNSLSASNAASSAFAGGSGSQSAASAFGFNSNGFQNPRPQSNFGESFLDIRHRGVPSFPFPDFVPNGKAVGAAAFKTSNPTDLLDDDFLAILVSS